MKILHFEDNAFKHVDVKKAVEMAGRHELVWVQNLEDGFAEIRRAMTAGHPFDLIITDMHFPLNSAGEDSFRAGQAVIDGLLERGLKIPVIVCSSMNIRLAGAYGAVWYSNLSDWDMELAELIRGMKKA